MWYSRIRIALLILLSSLFFVLCNSPSKDKQNNIELAYELKKYDFSKGQEFESGQWVEEVDFLNLEKNKESSFGNINKLIIEDRIYIMDCFVTHQVVVFDTLGNYLFRVGNKGKGAGEYTQICDFDVLRNNDIVLYSRKEQKLIFYNNQGEYLSEQKTKFRADGFKPLVGGNFLFSLAKGNDLSKMVVETDSRLNPKESFIKFDEQHNDDKSNYKMFNTVRSDKILYSRQVSDTLYIFNASGEMDGLISIDFGKFSTPGELKRSYADLVDNRADLSLRYLMDTPDIISNYMFGTMWVPPGNKAFFWYDLENSKLYLEKLDAKTISHKNINIPLAKVSQKNVLVSYYDIEILELDNDKSLVPDDVKEHVREGGVSLCFYQLKI